MAIWDDVAKAGEDMMKDHKQKKGEPEPSEKEKAEMMKKMEKKPTAAYGRKKQGAGGGHAIYE